MSLRQGAGRLASLLAAAASVLARHGVEDPVGEAERIWEGVSGVPRSRLPGALGSVPPPALVRRFRERVRRRAAGEPLAYLEGRCFFHAIELRVDRRVLIPRADSECLVDAALERLGPGEPGLVLDLGTGSGCLLLAVLAARPALRGVGVDRSLGALEVARENARRLGLGTRCRFLAGDWLAPIGGGRAEMVLANPPYVAPGEELGPGVAEWEPAEALFTPPGRPLAAYAAILAGLPRVLAPGGTLVLEVGAGRAEAVAALCREHGLAVEEIRPDLGGIPRAVVARRQSPAPSRSRT